MQRLFNDGWSFVKLPNGSTYADAMQAVWQEVSLPHDFLISNHHNLYENADGWYRRMLSVPADALDKVWLLRFDGVYMDCDVLLNGEIICTHRYGYTAFDAELTGHLHAGDNELMVHIRHQSPNTRWYSGAGIYRDVTLHALEKQHMPLDGVYVSTCREGDHWTMRVQAEVVGEGEAQPVHRLYAPDGALVAEACGRDVEMQVDAPLLWSCKAPNCYQLETRLGEQTVRQNVGFKELRYDPNEGLFLNGEHIKLHGVCLHHDLGALGSAFHVKAARRQLKAMLEMGVNSLRTSHNPPARQVMNLCDEMGILVVDEAFDMWERPKTTYDYARFFKDNVESDVASWVRRDRNHPSLLMWSIGNEILDTHVDEHGQEITTMLHQLVRQHDPLHNAKVTIGSNFMPWEGAQKCAELVEAVGYNYGEKYYAAHHEAHPDWLIYGSETASALSSRGVYRFPASASILSDEDQQCSSLGNSTTSWGTKDMRRCAVEDLNTPYSLGQYLWTGIDYIGEPTPYHTRNSYFGMMDTAVFPKEYWYLYRALWTDEPMAHIGVHWDWNPGQMIDVAVMTTGAECELLLNGASLGRKVVDRRSVEQCLPIWQVPFQPGELCARAYDAQGCLIAEDKRYTPGDSARIVLAAEDDHLLADGEDMTFVTISVVDKDGHPVENAVDRVHVKVTGGVLLGLDNGDSTDLHEGYKTNTRRLFSGKLLAMVGAPDEPGVVRVEVSSPGTEPTELEFPAVQTDRRSGAAKHRPFACVEMPMERPVRKIELIPMGSKALNKEQSSVTFAVTTLPEDADAQPISYRVTTDKGIESPCAVIESGEGFVTVSATGDGDIYLRATCNNGYSHPRVISQQEISISGLGKPNLDPYGFVSAGLYTLTDGEITPGNEQGVAFCRDGYSMVGFQQVDFGAIGSDELTLPIFALDSDCHWITLWLGDPRQGGEKLAVLPYQKPSRWNVYQPETYKLPRRLTGVQTLCFSTELKVHLKGFSFTRQSRAWLPLTSLEADTVYGDSFERTEAGIMNIGNNVSLLYEQMDFGEATRATLMLDGATPLETNPVTVRFEREDGETLTTLAQFKGTGRSQQQFEMDVLPGVCRVSFVFLPGSQFDFYGFQFNK
ncbi:MAG: DUF4982 domain-containing protein [Clostridia bacterium]|nr:DUF4982 domain-containing protein [Clostridia bacterium]